MVAECGCEMRDGESLGGVWERLREITRTWKQLNYCSNANHPLSFLAAFLDGAGDGLMNYLFKWDSEALSDPSVWADAIGQVFFSLGVCMGVMTTYSSHNNKRTTNVPLSEKAISLR